MDVATPMLADGSERSVASNDVDRSERLIVTAPGLEPDRKMSPPVRPQTLSLQSALAREGMTEPAVLRSSLAPVGSTAGGSAHMDASAPSQGESRTGTGRPPRGEGRRRPGRDRSR